MRIKSNRRARVLGAALVTVLVTLTSCGPSPLAPEDPEWDEFCTIYVSAAHRSRMADAVREELTPEQIRRCRPIHVYVVEFAS